MLLKNICHLVAIYQSAINPAFNDEINMAAIAKFNVPSQQRKKHFRDKDVLSYVSDSELRKIYIFGIRFPGWSLNDEIKQNMCQHSKSSLLYDL